VGWNRPEGGHEVDISVAHAAVAGLYGHAVARFSCRVWSCACWLFGHRMVHRMLQCRMRRAAANPDAECELPEMSRLSRALRRSLCAASLGGRGCSFSLRAPSRLPYAKGRADFFLLTS